MRTMQVLPPQSRTLGCPGYNDQANGDCPCRRNAGGLGFTLPSIDFTSWQTWAIGGLAMILLYQLFFSKEKRRKRADRSAQLGAARARYQAQVRRIREAA